MNLKEAFRYQNKLQSFMDEAQGILDRDANVTKVENTYLRHKVMAEAEDETVLIAPETEYYEQITDIAQFLLYLLNEKDKLFAAIRTAKDALDIDMDSEVSLNATRQSIARTFKRMNDLRNSEQTISNGGTGYRFNAEGNQISYRCDVKRVTTINYDRNVIRAELGKLNRLADETSTKIDLCLVTSKVDYEPPFDANSSFAEAFEAYTENARAYRPGADRLFWVRQDKRIRIPVQVQMNYKAAHIRKDIPVRLTLRAFMIGEKKRSASPSPPYILTSEPFVRHHPHSCFRTDISIVRHASLTRWLRDYYDQILIFLSP